MSGDYSRKTFDNKKHYSTVQQQQGRALLDSDWNEYSDILKYRSQTTIQDIIGPSGVPKDENGFQISISPNGNDLNITPGEIYIEGILCELDENTLPVSYLKQPHYPNPDISYFITSPLISPPASPPLSPPSSPPANYSSINIKDGIFIIYLDAWEREINYLDDKLIKEIALGDADSTTRLQVVWQIKLLEVTPIQGLESICEGQYIEWIEKTTPPTGKLNARTVEDQNQEGPCIIPPTTGYRRLENQLYRIEIHKGGTRDHATIKWSRDNASVQTKIIKIDGTIISVADLGKDEVLGFAADQWVEIIDEEAALNCSSNSLFQIDKITPKTNEITLKSSADSFKNKKNLKLCRWDQSGILATADGMTMKTTWMKIEDGIEVCFSDGNYCDGDYWLIPARTATGEIEWPPYKIPNLNPEEQLPSGIKHHFCKLAILEVQNGQGKLTDCRMIFPELTNLTAEDIKYDHSYCNINKADNVQEAIDMLCALNDMRDHNKFIHGYGVVCGMKVICGGIRTDVMVEKGYALDCEGNVIQVKSQNEVPYNIVAQAAAANLLDNNGDGEVALYITGCTSTGPDLLIEEFIKKDFWDEVLEGTLLKNFYDGCIKNLFDFLKRNFPINFSDTVPVPLSQRRFTALTNLLFQFVMSASGPYAFMSGINVQNRDTDIDCSDEEEIGKYEDHILWCLYKELKVLLNSQTFCGMFDGDALFPSYEISEGLDTIFGPVFRLHHKFKLNPKGSYGYTSGLDNKIYVYNLDNKEFIQAVVFPASAKILVQDFVINSAGTELYALGLLDDRDSVFAKAEIDTDGKLTWENSSVRCGERYKSLAISPSDRIYTIQIATGLYEVTNIGLPSFSLTQQRAFNATGKLIISEDGAYAFAAEYQTNNNESAAFTHITRFDLANNAIPPDSYHYLGYDFSDDIAHVDDIIYITGYVQANPGQRVLGGYDLTTGNPAFPTIDLENSWLIRLAPFTDINGDELMLVSLADKFKIITVELNTYTRVNNFRIPTQIFPMDMVVDQDNQIAFVINILVNTLTQIDLSAAFDVVNPPNFANDPPNMIATYRDGVIDAFKDLLSHFLQYLKDCFSDKFLVDCPECAENDKVYLASIEIKNNKVYNINNFSKRKYVKTPELWEYWLSTIPILPIFKEKFKEFCGKIL